MGVTAIAVLCAGDGFADIIGRRYGASNTLPHSSSKVSAFQAYLLSFAAIPMKLHCSLSLWRSISNVSKTVYTT